MMAMKSRAVDCGVDQLTVLSLVDDRSQSTDITYIGDNKDRHLSVDYVSFSLFLHHQPLE